MFFRKMMGAFVVAQTAWAMPVAADEAPKSGGELIVAIAQGDPDTYDCHATRSIASLYRLAPHYSTLLRYSAENYPEIIGDAAESWTVSDDGLVFTFKVRPGVTFHDGSVLDATDIKVTLDRMRNPPEGVASIRQSHFNDIASVETPDDSTVVVTLSRPNASMPAIFAGPFNCIYSSELLASNPDYPAKVVMGSGPFVFGEHQAGAAWTGSRFDNYYAEGLPHLDSLRLLNMPMPAAVNAMSAGQVATILPSPSEADVERIKASQGDEVVAYPAIDVTVLFNVAFNTSVAPFDDIRVRQALNLAIDRKAGSAALSKIASASGYGGMMRPGSEYERPAADLEKMPGFGTDIEARRAEARKLLKEAGQEDLTFVFKNWNRYTPLGVFLIDQWRQVGVTVTQEALDIGAFFGTQRKGDYVVTLDAIAEYTDDPTLRFAKFLSLSKNPRSLEKAEDPVFDDLYAAQSVEIDPAKRREIAMQIEDRMMDQARTIPLFWSRRPMAVKSDVKGFAIPKTPSNYVGLDYRSVWIDK